jgi:hypothetical protein
VARFVGAGAFLGQREGVLFQHRALAAGPRVADVGARAEAVLKAREDFEELVWHQQLLRLDAVLRRQRMQVIDASAAGEIGERVCVAVSVAGAVEDVAGCEVFKM